MTAWSPLRGGALAVPPFFEPGRFPLLIDDVRHELAMSYLDEGEIKLQDLAFLVGFSSHASFSAAFKRWTGKTPREVRALA